MKIHLISRLGLKVILTTVVSVALMGCVLPLAPRDAYIPPDGSAAKNQATLYIYRPKAFMGGGSGVHIHIDDRKAGKVGNGGSVIIDVSAGSHTIEAFTWNSAASAPVVSYGLIGGPIEREFLPGKDYYLRFKFGLYAPHDRFEFTTEGMYKNR